MDYFNEINLGATANDGNGDPIRTGGNTVNENFAEAETQIKARVEEAPNDGNDYVRRDSAWEEVNISSNGGFSGDWKLISDSSADPSIGSFTTDNTDLSRSLVVKVHRTALDNISFDSTINKIGGIKFSDEDGNISIFEVNASSTSSSFVTFDGSFNSGTLSTLTVNDNYLLSFIYGEQSETISNYFCTSWTEVKAAVALCNAANGGNIYMSGDIILTESVSWDLTNITFIGSSNCRWRVLNQDYISDGSTSKTVTATAGNINFKDVQFRGSGGGANNQEFSLYTSRPLFIITSGDSDVILKNCPLIDMIGGVAGNNIIEYTSLTSGTVSEINIDGCRAVSSNNAYTPFLMEGLTVKTLSQSGTLVVSVINQKIANYRSGLNGTDMKYSSDLNDPTSSVFNTDGTAYGDGDFDASNSEDEISILENDAGDLSGLIRFRDTDGVMKNMTLTQLKTLLA